MAFTRTQLRAGVFRDLPGQFEDATNNQLVTAADVNTALQLAEQEWHRKVNDLRRVAVLVAVNDQAIYEYPEDVFTVEDVLWNTTTTPVTEVTEQSLRNQYPDYRSADESTPLYWFRYSSRELYTYPATLVAASEYLTLYTYYVPLSIGTSIAALSRTSPVVTCSTTTRHNLRVGDAVTISKCGTSSFNVALTVATVPSETSFTAAQVGTNVTLGSSYGYLAYTGGVLPMVEDADVPIRMAETYQMAVRHGAVAWVASNLLVDDQGAMMAGQVAQAKFEQLVAKHEEDRWI